MVLSGEYSRIGKLGVKAQAAYKAEHGHVPQYEKRSAAVTLSNIEHPRRRKKGQTAMPQYYAITFHERKTRERGSGRQQVVPAWFIASGPHASRQAAENAGLELYAPRANEDGGVDNLDFTTETDRKNLRVVPTSKLKEYHIDLDMVTQ